MSILSLFFIWFFGMQQVWAQYIEPKHLKAVKIHPYCVTEFPSKESDTVDYVIITTSALSSGFDNFVSWKSAKGVNCVVRTVEWIDKHYYGSDTPERLRNFLRDAYYNWGTKYVLLGGDVPDVPTRYVRSTNHYPGYYDIATDMYYASLDGSWNANGNDVWGEVGVDSTTYEIHLFVGRLPGLTSHEIQSAVNKIMSYEHGSLGQVSYKNRLICVAGELYGGVADGAVWNCIQIGNCFPDYFERHLLHDIVRDTTFPDTPFGPIDTLSNLSKQAFLDSLKMGYSYLYAVVHGSPSQDWAYPCNINRMNADTLHCPWFLMAVTSCYTNWVEVSSLAEHFMLNPDGWAFAYRGTNRVGWAHQEVELNKYFYTKLFSDLSGDSTTEIGNLDAYARSKIVPGIFPGGEEQDNNYRDTYFAYLLLGDPELRLWINLPESLDVDFPEVVDIGSGEFTVSVRNSLSQPIRNARVCVSRKDELYARGFTDANGEITFVLCPEAGGVLTLVVTAQNFLPYEGSIFVNPTQPFVRYKSHFVGEIVEAGKEYLLYLSLENKGAIPATNVNAKLTPNTTMVTMIDSLQYYGDIPPSAFGTRSYRILVNKYCFSQQVCFQVECQSDIGASQDTFHLEVYAPELSHYAHSIDKDSLSPWVPVSLSCKIKNFGTGKARKIKANLISLSSSISVLDSLEEIDSIGGGKIGTYRNCFCFVATDTVDAPIFVITLEDSLERRWADTFCITFPNPPDSLYTFSGPHTVGIGWKFLPGMFGYNVYRAPDTVLLNFEPVRDNPLFMDNEPTEFTWYSYWVTAIDSTLNESKLSKVVSGMPNPFLKNGWPRPSITTQAYFNTSTAAGDIVPSVPGLEVVVNGDDGIIYAWYQNGQGILSPQGIFAQGLGSCWSSPVVADIDNDSSLEIIRAQGFAGNPKLYVFKNDGSLLPNFPVSLQGDFGTVASPSVQDLDRDGLLEIIALGQSSGNIYVFRADGTGFLNPNGIFGVMDSSVGSFGAPAVADIDNDDTLEIITMCIGGLYVWKPSGELLPNWPVRISGSPSSPAIGDVDPSYPGLEIVIHTTGHWLYVFHSDTTLFWRKKCFTGTKADRMSSPTLGDIDGDSLLEIALIGIDKLHLWNHDGTFVRNQAGVPVESLFIPMMTTITRASPVIGDVDGDDEPEIIVISVTQGDIYALEKDGAFTPGFPIMANGLTDGTPTLVDIDMDGHNELLLATATPDVKVWDVLGNRVEWSTFAHDRWHTGLYGFVPPDAPVPVNETYSLSPISCHLFQNTPNPFSNATNIKFQVPTPCKVTLRIYDVVGRLVRTLIDQELTNHCHAIKWQGEDNRGNRLPSGVYFYKLSVSAPYGRIDARYGSDFPVQIFQITKKLILL